MIVYCPTKVKQLVLVFIMSENIAASINCQPLFNICCSCSFYKEREYFITGGGDGLVKVKCTHCMVLEELYGTVYTNQSDVEDKVDRVFR